MKEFARLAKLLHNCTSESDLHQLSPFLLEGKLRPRLVTSLQDSLNYSVQVATVKNTSTYVIRNTSDLKVSYKQAKHRFLRRPRYYSESKLEDMQ